MEPQDHIATVSWDMDSTVEMIADLGRQKLCAAGTLGIAATGLALAVPTGNDFTYHTTPGKRKWPGASSLKSNAASEPSFSSPRLTSQPIVSPVTATSAQPSSEPPRPLFLFRRQSRRDVRPTTAENVETTASRGSSTNRSGAFRPRTADTRSTSEKRDPSVGSSWLKRISSVSSPRASSPSAASSNRDSTPQSMTSLASGNQVQTLPNKLVKRSTSQRALSNDHARGIFLKRPATSHQRSATVQDWTPRDISFSSPTTPYLTADNEPVWRPFFDRGYPRKRHTSPNVNDAPTLRTISASKIQQPTLILGSEIENFDTPNDHTDKQLGLLTEARAMSTGRQKLRRSLSSVHRAARRRHFTDPTVKLTTDPVNGTFTSAIKQSPLSSSLQTSTFNTHLAQRPVSFNSSPSMIVSRNRFSLRKRQSTAPSDLATTSSDNDTPLFTDDDSMDFQSDTAYDSLTTRATASSHSALRTPKLDSVFTDPQAAHSEEADTTLAGLVQKATLTEEAINHYAGQSADPLRAFCITEIEEDVDAMDFVGDAGKSTTPIKSANSSNDDYNMTPIPHRLQYFDSPPGSSPPGLEGSDVREVRMRTPDIFTGQKFEEANDDDVIDWSPKSDTQEKTSTSTLRQDGDRITQTLSSSPDLPRQLNKPNSLEDDDIESEQRQSTIFDWSEHQKVGGDGAGGMLLRPRTVHGKQGADGPRNRSSGRKGPTQMHLRSQSVPNNRDPNAEQPPASTSKFGTWGLGHKPVSEEWSDDFEFDDADGDDVSTQVPSGPLHPVSRGPSRGVKVPQAIIEQQARVHIQFGQVQEFMLLVEELKGLRARGAALQLLETHSKQLWEDAEGIIDLATINDEENDVSLRPSSPAPSDIFDDESSNAPKAPQIKPPADEPRRSSTIFRSVSGPATPPHGRPRGESLAHAKNFLQSIHQSRSGFDSSPLEFDHQPQRKLPFDTQDLKDLVIRSGVITRALKEIVRKAEGISVSPTKTPPRLREPAFSQIFHAPDSSPCPPYRKPGLPKSHSANSYLTERFSGNNLNTANNSSMTTSPSATALVL